MPPPPHIFANLSTSKKKDQVARIGVRGGGLGDSGNARKKTFFSIDVFPKEYRKLKGEIAELRKKNKMQQDCVEATKEPPSSPSEIRCHICQMLFKSESRLATLIAREAHYENEHRKVTTTTTTKYHRRWR